MEAKIGYSKNERSEGGNYRNGYYPKRSVATEMGDITVKVPRDRNGEIESDLVLCADGLTGLKDAISGVYPKTEYQRCIVNQIRNSLKYVPYKDRKEVANDLKTVYTAATEEDRDTNLLKLEEKWPVRIQNWDLCLSQFPTMYINRLIKKI